MMRFTHLHRFSVLFLFSIIFTYSSVASSGLLVHQATGEQGTVKGLIIDVVIKDSPAMHAGLLEGDIITEVDSVPVFDAAEFINIVRKTPPSGKLKIKLLRNEQVRLLEVVPVRDNDASPLRIGAGVSNFHSVQFGEPILRIDAGEHTALIRSMATDSQGRWIVTASRDKTAKIWSLTDGKLLTTLRPPIGDGFDGIVETVALSPDGTTVALGGWITAGIKGNKNLNIFLFDRASGRLLHRIPGQSDTTSSLAFSPDGHSLAVIIGAGDARGVYLFDVSTGKLIDKDSGEGGYGGDANSVDFSRDGRFVTTSLDGYIRVYKFDGRELTLLNKLEAPGGAQPTVARFSPDAKRIAVGFADSSAVNVLDSISLELQYAPDTKGMPGNSKDVTWSSDGLTLYAKGPARNEGVYYIRRWNKGGAGVFGDWPMTKSALMALLSLPNGRLAFSQMDTSWGVLSASGVKEWRHTPATLNLNEYSESIKLSSDGAKVRFAYEAVGASPIAFDIQQRAFIRANTEGLNSPSTLSFDGVKVTDWDYGKSPKLNGVALPMHSNEGGLSMALSKNEDGFSLGTTRSLISFTRAGKIRWKLDASAPVWSVNASSDGRFVVAAYGDGTIRWYRASDGVEQLAFFPHADKKRWILWTPEGYYDASPGGEELIGWHLNQGKDNEARFIPSSQLYDVFFRPDIVQAKFRGDDISSLITLTATQALKFPPPILSFTKVPFSTKSNMEQVCYKAVATGGGIGEVRLFQNGKLIKSDGFYREAVAKDKSGEAHVKLASIDSAAVTRALKLTKSAQQADVQLATNSKGNEYTECQEVETIPGDNEISVAAFNANNTIQSSLETMHFTADRKAEDPHLYVLGIGIDKYTASENNLSFAVKDATDFRTTIQAKAKGLYKDGNIHIEGLSDAQATKASIQKAIAAISTQVKPWDSFILFVASHGHLQGNQYYIVTSDFDGVVDTSKMISSNEIVGMSKNIKSLSQLLIFDTCHAGGVDNIIGGLYDARMSVMAKKMGLHIYASAGSTQTALDGYQGNGLFTHALLDSMKTADKTDSNHDKEVSVAELGESAKQETLEISTKLGSPQTPNIINFGKDNPVFRLGEKTVVAAYCPLCPDMATIPAGSFNMGSSNGRSDEKPQHRVSFAKPFSIGKTEVTQAQWRAIMGGNPSQHKGCDSCPVEQVSWDDAQAYIKELNAKTGRQYRLPSEAEWEYACRAGGQHEFCGSDAIESISWYGGHTPDIPQPGQPDKSTGNSRNNTHPVATKQANAWGVYDMTGNVAEWVEDSYHGKYKSGVTDGSYNGAPSDGSVWAGDGLFHVCRGGDYYGMSWKGEAATELARAARRDLGRPNKIEFDLGFRLASDEVMENRNAAK